MDSCFNWQNPQKTSLSLTVSWFKPCWQQMVHMVAHSTCLCNGALCFKGEIVCPPSTGSVLWIMNDAFLLLWGKMLYSNHGFILLQQHTNQNNLCFSTWIYWIFSWLLQVSTDGTKIWTTMHYVRTQNAVVVANMWLRHQMREVLHLKTFRPPERIQRLNYTFWLSAN